MSTTKPHHDAESDSQLVEQADEKTTIFYPRGLNIVWGSDPRYWRLPPDLKGAVELVQVSWLEVTGSRENLKPSTKYEIGFKISLTQEAFGWNGSKVYVMAKLGRRGKYSWKRASLENFQSVPPTEIPLDNDKLTITTTSETTIYFGMYEVWSGKWKGGLKIHNAYIREV